MFALLFCVYVDGFRFDLCEYVDALVVYFYFHWKVGVKAVSVSFFLFG